MSITKESLIKMLKDERPGFREAVIGRALVAIFKFQTESEQAVNETRLNNMVGFTGADAYSGSLTAKYYLKHKSLLPWQVDLWMKPNVRGVPRIAKYWKQLDRVSKEK